MDLVPGAQLLGTANLLAVQKRDVVQEENTYLVGHNSETPLGGGRAVSKDLIDEAEQLLHDRILAQIIIA